LAQLIIAVFICPEGTFRVPSFAFRVSTFGFRGYFIVRLLSTARQKRGTRNAELETRNAERLPWSQPPGVGRM